MKTFSTFIVEANEVETNPYHEMLAAHGYKHSGSMRNVDGALHTYKRKSSSPVTVKSAYGSHSWEHKKSKGFGPSELNNSLNTHNGTGQPMSESFKIDEAAAAPKHPSVMTAGEINKALDRHDVHRSKLDDEMIATGRGSERPSEFLHRSKTDPLSLKLQAASDTHHALHNEISRRYGPGAPRRLPKGFGPIK
jgi:hypothetical protein